MINNHLKYTLILLVMLFGCERYEDNMPYTLYEIKEGKHSSRTRLSWLLQSHLSYEVIFDNSCRYATKDSSKQLDINKLFGFSDCNSHHQSNSARFGWRWNNNQLEVLSYCYKNGTRTATHIAYLALNEPYRCHIYLFEDHYELEVEGFPRIIESRADICTRGTYYQLWPYFGGTETAPHNITIHMRKII